MKGRTTHQAAVQKAKLSSFSAIQFLKSSWWSVLFCAICLGTYVHAAKSRNCLLSNFLSRLQEIELATQRAIERREDLALRLDSQTDPSWIEMVLMKELGVVPEGWIKVHFKR